MSRHEEGIVRSGAPDPAVALRSRRFRPRGKPGRRAVLRGAGGLLLGLPFLESLIKPTRAAEGTPPKRLIIMYSSNGTVLKNWRPTTTGAGFAVPPILAPLDTPLLRPKLTVPSGLRMACAQDTPGNGHAVGMTSMLTGRAFTEVVPTEFGDVGWGAGISIDQLIASRVADPGQLPSIELGIQSQKDYGNFYSYMSYGEGGGSTNAIASDDDPRNAFQRLFANVPDDEAAKAALQAAIDRRKSVLDFVQGDFASIQGRLGKDDQARLDKHLELLRELEDRLAVGAVCGKPSEPVFTDSELLQNDNLPAIGKAQMDLLAAAFACDITRVGTLQWATAQAGTVFNSFVDAPWDQLADDYHHGLSHLSVGSDEPSPDPTQQLAQSALSSINAWFSSQMAYLAERLAEYQEEDGTTVLDNTAILWVSEISEGPTHRFDHMPYVLLGDMGGALKGGVHVDFENNRTHNDLFVTLAQAMGAVDVTTFGASEYVTGPLTEILG